MGTYYRSPLLKIRHTRRGWRAGVGPSWFRRWYGAGGKGTSTGFGAGPFWFGRYFPSRRRNRRL